MSLTGVVRSPLRLRKVLLTLCRICTEGVICGRFTNIHCHSAHLKCELARALKEENAINNVLEETSEIDQKSCSVNKGDATLKSNILLSPRARSRCCGRAGIFFETAESSFSRLSGWYKQSSCPIAPQTCTALIWDRYATVASQSWEARTGSVTADRLSKIGLGLKLLRSEIKYN